MSSLTLLGTGTCQIEYERRASSVLLELEQTHILFDCGHGIVQRLLEVGLPHHQLSHVILSHFHPDHVSDLIPSCRLVPGHNAIRAPPICISMDLQGSSS
ncbi:MBL fold metallo-hydrolase [Dictyobacter kobayashii]|uniref:Uncharacterized protein n=1 Tax=Dictyobacter kobayashii TaxID=2014872 RepID=A0A402AL08_9CHLR|nr:MBL fold metallo-hydrolase [Dictyobacter kobayashii]GCE19816.1 hypothetical protein KDK_36160 [Dictyobacter kobayashii]